MLLDVYLEDVYDIKCPRSRSNILSTRIPELLHGVVEEKSEVRERSRGVDYAKGRKRGEREQQHRGINGAVTSYLLLQACISYYSFQNGCDHTQFM